MQLVSYLLAIDVFVELLFAPALLGLLISFIPTKCEILKNISLSLCCISCLVGISTYFIADGMSDVSYQLPISSVLGDYRLKFDDLSSLMVSFSSFVFLMIVIHSMRRGRGYTVKYAGLMNILLIVCIAAMCADSVIMLLIAWESISLTTFIMSYGADDIARWRYFVITHLGGLMIMAVFAAMWYVSGTGILSEMSNLSQSLGSGVATVMIVLLFLGFGTKLGCTPFHAWMSDLYYSSPIHSVALLSTVCSNVAILLLVKSTFLWIGVPDNYILPILLLLLASATAIWGAMESMIQTEPRRILAYSSMENMAMVMICLGTGILFTIMDFDSSYLVIILAAGMLHTLNHSFFKSLMLLNVGTVEDSTGVHAIERMGGLSRTLPVLSIFALVGTLSMAAVPPTNGFVSEWLMIKTVISSGVGDSVMNVVLPMIVAVLGICGMMAAASYARMYGFMFLGRPRSEEVAKPNKVDRISLVPLGMLAVCCVVMGVFSMPIIYAIAGSACDSLDIAYVVQNTISDSLNLVILSSIMILICLVLYLLFRLFRKKKDIATTWDCGIELKPNMQYSSVGFSQPLVRVFHPFYGDTTEITDDVEEDTSVYRIRFVEPFYTYVLSPIGRGAMKIANKIGLIQTGNIQAYLAYLLITLIVVLLAVRFV